MLDPQHFVHPFVGQRAVLLGGSGHQLAERLVATCPRLKVLFMSGYVDEVIFPPSVLDPSVHYLQKPITPGALLQKVRRAIAAPGASPPAGTGLRASEA